MGARVLVVDDDADIRRLVSTLVENAGMTAIEAADGTDALRTFFEAKPDLAVLDLAMPGMDGIELLRRLRDMSDVPVLLLTANAAELTKVRSLKSGADDYVTKPFSPGELVARIEALLRRAASSRDGGPDVISDRVVTIDFSQASATVAGTEVHLTPREFTLLAALLRHPNQLLAHDQLVELVWGHSRSGSRDQLKVYVGQLRRKMREAAGVDPIETVRGFGYRYRRES